MIAKHYKGIDLSDAYLEHYGVEGMKWGIRKAVSKGYRNFVYNQAAKKLEKLKANSADLNASNAARQKAYNKIADKVDNYVNDTTGRYGRGNIDLNHRKVIVNKDGSISTEYSFSTKIDGKETLLPQLLMGNLSVKTKLLIIILKLASILADLIRLKKL